jgi:hypothetical protein
VLRRRLLPATIDALSIAMAEKVPQKRQNARALRRPSGSVRFSHSFLPLGKRAHTPVRLSTGNYTLLGWMNEWMDGMDASKYQAIG